MIFKIKLTFSQLRNNCQNKFFYLKICNLTILLADVRNLVECNIILILKSYFFVKLKLNLANLYLLNSPFDLSFRYNTNKLLSLINSEISISLKIISKVINTIQCLADLAITSHNTLIHINNIFIIMVNIK